MSSSLPFNIFAIHDLYGKCRFVTDAHVAIDQFNALTTPKHLTTAVIFDHRMWSACPPEMRNGVHGRMCIVLSHTLKPSDSVQVHKTLDDALFHLANIRHMLESVWVVGSYKAALKHPNVQSVHTVVVHCEVHSEVHNDMSVYFPLKYLTDWFMEDDSLYKSPVAIDDKDTVQRQRYFTQHVWIHNTPLRDRLRCVF
jgi:dihydrofolate reductase